MKAYAFSTMYRLQLNFAKYLTFRVRISNKCLTGSYLSGKVEERIMQQNERRANTRVPAKFKITYIHKGDYLISFTRDISVGGMFLYTDNPPPVGDYPELSFSIGELHDVKVRARVVWVNRTSSLQDSGAAVQFIDPPSFLKEAILQFVNKIAIFEDEATS
jgi:c-di-GMP-binding flagellar brake protein YcgR